MEEKKNNKSVELHIPRSGPKTEQQVVIGVNGVNYVIPKGQRVTVPDYVAAEYERSVRASDKMFRNKEDLIQKEDGELKAE
ncbi:MAG: hypothetical protein IKI69_05675 [Oscillospiraceae bacterium]|nr:hypothetical protein [Oscillospiraceae bacterium]